MNSIAEQGPDIRNRGERRGICSHCGWYEGASSVKTYDTRGNYTVGAVKSTAKYRIVM